MPQLRGLIFDLEGVLIDSAHDLCRAINHMLGHHGRRNLEMGEIRSMLGDGMLVLTQRALAKTGVYETDKEMNYFREFITHFRSAAPDPEQVFPQVRDILTRYHANGIKLGVCTNKPSDTTCHLLQKLKLLSLFGFVAGGGTYQVHIPNPDHLSGVITALDLTIKDCVVVGGDSRMVTAAHKLDLPCIIVTKNYGVDYSKLEATKQIASFDQLPEALAQLGY